MDSASMLARLVEGYDFAGPCLDLGAAVVDGAVHPEAPIRLPLAMLNRHGLVAGATGTGKTVTLQVMAEQLAAAGVSVFLADIKGDLSGLAQAAQPSQKLTTRLAELGRTFTPHANAVEFLTLGEGTDGIPVRATVDSFGPILLARVLELNETQEQVLQLVFHFADQRQLPLDDLKDLRAVFEYLLDDAGRADLKSLGGVSAASAAVILRGLTILQAQGLEQFFGQPEFEIGDLLREGIINVLELPALTRQPLLFSTFLMWLLAELFEELPEVGDLQQPRLVFFLDEAHLLFKDASRAFRNALITTVRLIRSKGVGLFFVTQSPADLPEEVLAQLGARIQHAVRVFTPKDAAALKQVVATFPAGELDVGTALTQAGVGEAVITVLDPRGIPTPAAWTRLSSPGSRIGPADRQVCASLIAASPLVAKYATGVDRQSAHEILTGAPQQSAQSPTQDAGLPESTPAQLDEEARRIAESILGRPTSVPPIDTPLPGSTLPETRDTQMRDTQTREAASRQRSGAKSPDRSTRRSPAPAGKQGNDLMELALDAANLLGREVLRGMFGTKRRRRR